MRMTLATGRERAHRADAVARRNGRRSRRRATRRGARSTPAAPRRRRARRPRRRRASVPASTRSASDSSAGTSRASTRSSVAATPLARSRAHPAGDVMEVVAPHRGALVRLRRQRRHAVVAARGQRLCGDDTAPARLEGRLLRAGHFCHQLQIRRHRVIGGEGVESIRPRAEDVGARRQDDARRLRRAVGGAVGDDGSRHGSFSCERGLK